MSVVEKARQLAMSTHHKHRAFAVNFVGSLADAGLLSQEWRPIAEAPRDVEIIYLAYRKSWFVSSCRWSEGEINGTGWWDDATAERAEPLYWIALPTLPKRQEGA